MGFKQDQQTGRLIDKYIMAWTVDLPRFDNENGSLSPLVLSAMQAGATVTNHFVDDGLITVEFGTQATANAFASSIQSFEGAVNEPSSVTLTRDHAAILSTVAAGATVAQLGQPFGAGTVYTTVGTVPAQLVLSGRNIIAGSSPAISGNNYSIRIRATDGAGLRSVEEVFSFFAIGVTEIPA